VSAANEGSEVARSEASTSSGVQFGEGGLNLSTRERQRAGVDREDNRPELSRRAAVRAVSEANERDRLDEFNSGREKRLKFTINTEFTPELAFS